MNKNLRILGLVRKGGARGGYVGEKLILIESELSFRSPTLSDNEMRLLDINLMGWMYKAHLRYLACFGFSFKICAMRNVSSCLIRQVCWASTAVDLLFCSVRRLGAKPTGTHGHSTVALV